MKIITGFQALQVRLRLNMNQSEFWERVGSSQSAGSRYEQGRRLPRAVQLLLTLAYTGEEREKERSLRQLRNWELAA